MAGRPCSLCSHRDRVAAEAALAAGESPARISTELGMSISAVYRHMRNHAGQALRAVFEGTGADLPRDLAQRVVDIADDVRRARRAAQEAGAVGQMVRAADTELRALALAVDRLGIDSTDLFDRLGEAEDIATAMGAAARADAAVGEALVAALRTIGRDALADALAAVTPPKDVPIRRLAALR